MVTANAADADGHPGEARPPRAGQGGGPRHLPAAAPSRPRPTAPSSPPTPRTWSSRCAAARRSTATRRWWPRSPRTRLRRAGRVRQRQGGVPRSPRSGKDARRAHRPPTPGAYPLFFCGAGAHERAHLRAAAHLARTPPSRPSVNGSTVYSGARAARRQRRRRHRRRRGQLPHRLQPGAPDGQRRAGGHATATAWATRATCARSHANTTTCTAPTLDDEDGDGVASARGQLPDVANADQADSDGDGKATRATSAPSRTPGAALCAGHHLQEIKTPVGGAWPLVGADVTLDNVLVTALVAAPPRRLLHPGARGRPRLPGPRVVRPLRLPRPRAAEHPQGGRPRQHHPRDGEGLLGPARARRRRLHPEEREPGAAGAGARAALGGAHGRPPRGGAGGRARGAEQRLRHARGELLPRIRGGHVGGLLAVQRGRGGG